MAMSRSFGGRSLTTRSPIVISPAVISSSPATIRSVVDLPHPEGPTRTMNSLSRMWRFTSLTACTSSYFLLRSFIITCAMVSLPLPSAFHGPGQARDVVLHEERVDEGDGDRAEQRARHQLAPEVDVAADELGHHSDGHRLLLRRREEDERVDELVPRQREGEDPRREDAGHGDREDDPHHRAEARRAVDPRALLELLGDRLEISHEEPRTERDQERRVRQNQRPRRVADLEGANDVRERDEEERRRYQVRHEDRRREGARHGEPESGERVPRQEPAEERDRR